MAFKDYLPVTRRSLWEAHADAAYVRAKTTKTIDKFLRILENQAKQDKVLKKELSVVKGQVTTLRKNEARLKKAVKKHLPNLEW